MDKLPVARVTYKGGLPQADETVVLVGPLKPSVIAAGYVWIVIELCNSSAGTLRLYESVDNEVTWTEVDSIEIGENPLFTWAEEFHIGALRAVKLEWDNGNTDQTTFDVACAICADRDPVSIARIGKRLASVWIEGEDDYSIITSDAYEAIANQGQIGGQFEQATAINRPAAAHVEAGGVLRRVARYSTSDTMDLSVNPSHADGATRMTRIVVVRNDNASTSFNYIEGDDFRFRLSSVGRYYFTFDNGATAYFTYDFSNAELCSIRAEFDGTGATNADRLKAYLDEVQQSLTFSGTIPTALATGQTDLTIGAGYDLVHGALVDLVGPACTNGPAIAQYLLNKYVNPNVFVALNPTLYLDYRYGVTADEDWYVTGWWDGSGHNNDFLQTGGVSLQPLLTADGILLDGIDNYLVGTGPTHEAETTIALVGRCYADSANGRIFRHGGGVPNLTDGTGVQFNNVTDSWTVEAVKSQTLSDFALVFTQEDGVATSVRLNGVEVDSGVPVDALAGKTWQYLGGIATSANSHVLLKSVQHFPEVKSDAEIFTWMQEANDVWELGIRDAQLVPGNVLELDASETSTVHTDAYGVYQWDDLSGSGNHATQSTDSHKPGYTSGESLDFTDTEDHHLIADAVAAHFTGDDQPMTIIAVYETTDTADSQAICCLSLSSDTDPQLFLYARSTADTVYAYRRDDSGSSAGLVGPTAEVSGLVEYVFTGTSGSLRLNGGTPSTNTQDVGTLSLDRFAIGIRQAGLSLVTPLLGKLKHLLVYNRELSAAELTFLRNSLNAKWSVY